MDWQRESSKMATIYQNSYLSIAATKFKDSSGGIFSSGDPYDSKGLVLKLSQGNANRRSRSTPAPLLHTGETLVPTRS